MPAPDLGAAVLPQGRAPQLDALPHVQHGFFGRLGGVSQGVFASLNVGPAPAAVAGQPLPPADAPAHLRENRRRILAAVHRPHSHWHQLRQVHGRRVVRVHKPGGQGGAAVCPEADAQLTQDADVTLAIYTADCLPILFASRQVAMVAAVHAGWRGTAANVAAATVQQLVATAGGAPADWLAVLGPAIGPCCYTVTAPVARALWAVGGGVGVQPLPATDLAGVSVAVARACLRTLNAHLLGAAGLLPENIVSCGVPAAVGHASAPPARSHDDAAQGLCTYCAPHCFSYRRAAGQTGRQASVIGLRPTT